MKTILAVLTLIVLALASCGVTALAQDSAPDLIDTLNTEFLRPSETKTTTFITMDKSGNVATNSETTEKYTVTMKYDFNYNRSYLDDSVTKRDTGNLSFKGPLPNSFSYTLALGVSGGYVESASDAETATSLSVNPSIQVAWTHTNIFFPSKDSLSIGGMVGYTSSENSSAPGAKLAFSQAAGWKESINANYAYKATPNLEFSLTPSYSYANNETVNDLLNTTTTTYKENISVTLGSKYILSADLTLKASAKWLHDINFSLAPGEDESLQDYAEFSCGVIKNRKILNHTWALEVDYAYDAFNASYFSHDVTAQLSVDF